MTLKTQSITMEAVCAIRSQYSEELRDNYSSRLLLNLPNAIKGREILDNGSNNMFSRSVVLRSLYFRDLLKKQKDNFEQLIILSAGLDLSVLDIAGWEEKKVFSIDHPYSQEFCKEVIEKAEIDTSFYDFIPFDLTDELTNLISLLEKEGLDTKLNTLIIWEGATYYFTPQHVYEVLEYFSRNLESITFVCDFLNKDSYLKDGKPANIYVEKNLKFLEEIGEPWRGLFSPTELKAQLKCYGFNEIEMIPREDIEKDFMKEVKMGFNKMFFMEAKKKKLNE
ncbi:class I SAM-dependent methyltransferase [Priestia megaterium]|jgi:methyltransferase (TIGR00027 family)|uniref:class I SAM-dependent methyltransferase n=1 Tax=Priestia TaxID=2800373 RepID=UPI000BF49EDE|nr:class I SAM-dependent methyltransferase [Priestia megaterium]AWD68594.1 hypothetical protein C2I28_26540 [Priestia megaterium]MED4030243.1 class I SAM-dependent methyltransferase [Priestia megaterium]PFL61093.1 hypothetical protein COJ36_26960 [Priestia megaterium]